MGNVKIYTKSRLLKYFYRKLLMAILRIYDLPKPHLVCVGNKQLFFTAHLNSVTIQ